MPSVIDEIARLRRPGDVANWWGHCVLNDWTHALEEEETNYMDVFTSADVEPVLRIGRGIATVENLDQHELQLARERYGEGRIALERFVNRENRRRIIAHYVWTHPATVQYELQLYRLTRDVNPVTFVADRIHQLFTGKELFIGDQVSRIGAAVDLLIPIVLTRILRAVRPAVGTSRPARPLTDPIYDLPPEGGGMMINGRWYTEHALERARLGYKPRLCSKCAVTSRSTLQQRCAAVGVASRQTDGRRLRQRYNLRRGGSVSWC